MITIIAKGQRSDGSHWTKLSKTVPSDVWGPQILTGFIRTAQEVPLQVDATTEVEPKGIKWEA